MTSRSNSAKLAGCWNEQTCCLSEHRVVLTNLQIVHHPARLRPNIISLCSKVSLFWSMLNKHIAPEDTQAGSKQKSSLFRRFRYDTGRREGLSFLDFVTNVLAQPQLATVHTCQTLILEKRILASSCCDPLVVFS